MTTFILFFISMEILFLVTSYFSKRKDEMIQSLLDLRHTSLYFLDWLDAQGLEDQDTVNFGTLLKIDLTTFKYENLVELTKNDILYFDLEANHFYAIKEVYRNLKGIVKTTQLKLSLPYLNDNDNQEYRIQSILLLQEILDRVNTIQKTVK